MSGEDSASLFGILWLIRILAMQIIKKMDTRQVSKLRVRPLPDDAYA